MKNILFVCTGNTCRSPMAEALLREKAGDRFDVRSAGVSASSGHPAANAALQVLQDRGIQFNHRSRPIDLSLVDWADLILTMTEYHKSAVQQMIPASLGKVYTLKEYVDDNPEARRTWEKLESCYAELETERALSHGEEVEWLEDEIRKLEKALPSYDISDPFGGTVDEYRRVCDEISYWLESLVKKESAGD